ncbi:MAG: hypothetical protein H0W02_14880 [Ktedonobacteraceae bacterium]|nr:hypothetical protein [Ktedonobacteraceae bacterium]
MPSVAMRVDLSTLIDATVTGDRQQILVVARELMQKGATADVLLGRVGMIAAAGDSDGHTILTLDAASVLSRWLDTYARLASENGQGHERALPLLVQVLAAAAPAVRAGQNAQVSYPEPFFPSDLPEGKTMGEYMHNAVYNNDPVMAERLLFGLYGTGADYRTMQVRAYEGIATTFQNAGHPLMLAARGFQLLDAVEWGDRAPAILHWLAPHLPLHTGEPGWVNAVRSFFNDPARGDFNWLRTRIAAPRNESALPLRQLVLGNADTAQVCQGVYDALRQGGASTQAVGSVIALAAADVMQRVGDADRAAFIQAAHGLLFASAVRQVFEHVHDMEAVPLLFTSAAFVSALQKEVGTPPGAPQSTQMPASSQAPTPGGGLIPTAILDTLRAQLDAQDFNGALASTRRYRQMGHEIRPLFATIGLAAAQADAADQGHTLQIVQAAGEETIGWPAQLSGTNIEAFLHIALRAAAFARHTTA